MSDGPGLSCHAEGKILEESHEGCEKDKKEVYVYVTSKYRTGRG